MNLLTVFKSPYNKIRLGKDNDGGYVICDIPDIKYDIILCGGIDNDISFEEDIIKKYDYTKCYAYDGTINDIKINNKNIKFIKKNIGRFNNDEYTNLQEFLDIYKNIFIKIDIEGYEIEWIESLDDSQLNNIAQLVIEFHRPFSDREINIFNKLNKNHILIHFHPNNCCGVRIHNNIMIPNIFECTYIHKKYYNKIVQLNTEKIPNPNIDMKNVISKDDIIIDYPPFVNKI